MRTIINSILAAAAFSVLVGSLKAQQYRVTDQWGRTQGAFAESNAAFSSPAASRSYEMMGNMSLSPDSAVLVEKLLDGSDISQMQRSTGCSSGCY